MNQCEGEVPYKLNFYRTRQCKNKAIVCRDGKYYCSIHDPVKIEERKAKREEKRKKDQPYKTAMYLAHLKLKNGLKKDSK